MKSRKFRNVVGTKVKKIRLAKGLQQQDLATSCNLLGFDISRSGIGQIEILHRQVVDLELVLLARALDVSVLDLIPAEEDLPAWEPRYNSQSSE